MGYQIYQVGNRWGGYGVPCVCEFPTCKKRIDRGISYACGGEPFSELGCDRYFCEKHRQYTYFDPEQDDGICKHEDDCECETAEVCERCAKNEQPFPYKPEVKSWVRHLLKHESWAEWRKKNPQKVKELLK
jgi:hypothetical protein